ncbi:NodT family efflux transporter outer membrane factor (OMF) lipoprotein [Rhodanobacter sp. K2T2]|uniref:efflux transporter outer membrane subunit n=1 Tax=Rhodanobacter sp. K2T2 TaxID=2723085 RepID=UPI0015CBDFD3|nr:TolC family protein [Rhodanobacter sp. K2T2]NYE27615.1 NodT family efflux transporter outer membrane factor (OMF) lipoprotein [Rhodanobacter sp. K2T2]
MNTTRKAWLTLAMLTSVSLAGCAVGPDYVAKDSSLALPTAFPSIASADLRVSSQPSRWWEGFNDAILNDLVDRAWSANFDVRSASAHLESALAEVRATKGEFFPSLSADESIGRSRQSELTSTTGTPDTATPTTASLGLSWQLDLFGRIRRSVELANADASAQERARDDMRRLIVGQVVRTYAELRGNQEELQLARERASDAQVLCTITEVDGAAGRASAQDVALARANVASIQADIPSLEARVRSALDHLASLVAVKLDDPLMAELARPQSLSVPVFVTVDTPSDLLKRRPDVRAAERKVAAATARIGIQTADLYPDLSIGGVLGFGALAPRRLGSDASRLWSGGVDVSWTPFNGGATRARIRAAGAAADAALADYDKTMAVALEEADVAINEYVTAAHRDKLISQSSQEVSNVYAVRKAEFEAGRASRRSLLSAGQDDRIARSSAVGARTDLELRIVDMYTAFAGGMDAPPKQSEARSSAPATEDNTAQR